jgi:hypothetical protein
LESFHRACAPRRHTIVLSKRRALRRDVSKRIVTESAVFAGLGFA